MSYIPSSLSALSYWVLGPSTPQLFNEIRPPSRLIGAVFIQEQEELRKRLKRLENSSGLAVPDDESKERRRITGDFAQGGGI
jgi:hypothetical protein